MRRRRRNPAIGKTLEGAVGVTVGVLATEVLPTMIGIVPTSGWAGVLEQGAVGLGVSLAARAMSKGFGDSVMVGSVASLLTSFLKAQFGLGGSPGLSFYVNNGFPLPTTGRGPYLLLPGYDSQPQMNGGM